MSPWTSEDWCRYLKIRLSPEKQFAFRVLEAAGLRFLVDFGTDNAIQKAADLTAGQAERGAGELERMIGGAE